MTKTSTRKKRRGSSNKPRKLGTIEMIIYDFITTALLPIFTVLIAEAAFGDARLYLSSVLNLNLTAEWTFIIMILIMLMVLGPLSQWLGGSLFNPCEMAILYVGGQCKLNTAVIRSIAQVAGALAGCVAAQRYLPPAWAQRGETLVAAIQPNIDTVGGASSEFLLTYLIYVFVFWTQRRTQSSFIKFFAPLLATAAALKIGALYSGPVLNPAAAISWTFFHWDKQPLDWMQHATIFWLAPVAASVFAKWTDMGMQAAAAAQKKTKSD